MKCAWLPMMLPLALVACGGPADRQNSSEVETVSNGEAMAGAPNNGVAADLDGAPTRNVAETPAPAPAPTLSGEPAVATIPASIQGRWGLVPADCTSTRGDAKGLLTIDADTVRFYESVGRVTKVAERDPGHFVADFAFTGEGMNWTRRMTLDAQDAARTLVRRETGPDALPGPLKYTRCKG